MGIADGFCDIARYYDQIMEHVDYDRWFVVAARLSELLPSDFRHLDAACGTGTLLRKFRRLGWNSLGVDLSLAMLQAGRKDTDAAPSAAADLRMLPFCRNVHYVTCLFDSVNFLVGDRDMGQAFSEVSQALTNKGLFYFDVVTERMVTDHFENQEWTERNGGFSTTWSSTYERKGRIAETRVRVNNKATGVFYERIYSQRAIERALREAGLTFLGAYDARTWTRPSRKTVRIDFVAAKAPSRAMTKHFRRVSDEIARVMP